MKAALDFPETSLGASIQYSLGSFSLGDKLHLALSMRLATQGKASMEEAAAALCQLLYDQLADDGGNRACPLVRFYKTHRYADLPTALQQFASSTLAPVSPTAETNCLTLLATVGDEPEWNSRERSKRHQAIPLTSPEVVESAPMIAQLIRTFGMEVLDVVRRAPILSGNLRGREYGLFYVAEAPGSPYIPAQSDFIEPYGIRSVLGFGGSLGSGDLFAAILFSRAPITKAASEHFRTLAADVREIIGGYRESAVFAQSTR